MYEAYNPETGELERVDFDQLMHRFANGTLVAELQEKTKRTRKPKAEDDENQG